jgi:hypothetical protein
MTLPAHGRSVRFLSDQQLLNECRLELFRGSGPGGQKRQKTSKTVRLTHVPTGVHVVAGESRSQAENKMRALRRLRLKLATELRETIDTATFEPPDWFLQIRQGKRIAASYRHPFYAPAAGLVLDLLNAMGGKPSSVAAMLGVSTTAVVRFLEDEPLFWAEANRIRAALEMPALTHRR